MFCLRKLLIVYYINNIDSYYNQFSLNDVIQILKFIIKNNNTIDKHDLYVCNKLLNNLYADDISIIKKNISNKQIINLLNEIDIKKLKKGKTISSVSYKTVLDVLKLFNSKPFAFKQQFEIFIKQAIDVFTKKWIIKLNKKKKTDKTKKGTIKMNIILPIIYSEDVCDIYVKTYCPSYKYLFSQVAQQTIKKVDKAYKSFFASIKSSNINHKVSLPKYLSKTGLYNLIFQKQSFKIIKKHKRGSLLRWQNITERV